jgi:hypothetical protein
MANEKATVLKVAPSDYTNASRLIHSGPCIVKCVLVSGDGASGDCQIYDGSNVNGKLKAHIEVLTGTSYTWCPGEGTDFDYGLYIAVNAATTKVAVTYLPESRKDFI